MVPGWLLDGRGARTRQLVLLVGGVRLVLVLVLEVEIVAVTVTGAVIGIISAVATGPDATGRSVRVWWMRKMRKMRTCLAWPWV